MDGNSSAVRLARRGTIVSLHAAQMDGTAVRPYPNRSANLSDAGWTQNQLATFLSCFHAHGFAELGQLHARFVHDLVHGWVVVIGIVMEENQSFGIGGRGKRHHAAD